MPIKELCFPPKKKSSFGERKKTQTQTPKGPKRMPGGDRSAWRVRAHLNAAARYRALGNHAKAHRHEVRARSLATSFGGILDYLWGGSPESESPIAPQKAGGVAMTIIDEIKKAHGKELEAMHAAVKERMAEQKAAEKAGALNALNERRKRSFLVERPGAPRRLRCRQSRVPRRDAQSNWGCRGRTTTSTTTSTYYRLKNIFFRKTSFIKSNY